MIGWLDGLVGKLPGASSLYQSLRRRQAQSEPRRRAKRARAIGAAVVLLPVARPARRPSWPCDGAEPFTLRPDLAEPRDEPRRDGLLGDDDRRSSS